MASVLGDSAFIAGCTSNCRGDVPEGCFASGGAALCRISLSTFLESAVSDCLGEVLGVFARGAALLIIIVSSSSV